jgi:circadian clock protein KaiC
VASTRSLAADCRGVARRWCAAGLDLKTENITAMLTSLAPGRTDIERTETTISSLMDTWIVLGNDDVGGVHRRGLYVLKSRGMAHSNELREFVLTDRGFNMLDAVGAVRKTLGNARYPWREGRSRHASS